MLDPFPATRSAALDRLDAFSSHVKRYAGTRNFIAAGHPHVSRLSAAIRHRLITEEEVVRFILERHSFSSIEKFLQEVCWRTYWKGWLAQRPGIWHDAVALTSNKKNEPSDLARDAMNARSGCGVMDEFTNELRSTGYLHNHARMWWAAYWIHHLKLPWALGAQFFLDHLLDADPASNTLSWRWVAGLHTPGKTYIARPDNIARYHPQHPTAGLDALHQTQPSIPVDHADLTKHPLPRCPTSIDNSLENFTLLVHAEDLSIEHSNLAPSKPAAIVFLDHRDSHISAARHAWLDTVIADAQQRLSDHYSVPITTIHQATELPQWLQQQQVQHLIAMAPQVGSLADALFPAINDLTQSNNLQMHWLQRPWDQDFYPAARSGFFPFWKKVSRAPIFHPQEPQQVFAF
jgi:deoxyribodipyrimidine photo-lyase